MDTDSIKVVLLICYLTLLVVVAMVWYRISLAPNGELYRRVRLQGGYMPRGPDEVDDAAPVDRRRQHTELAPSDPAAPDQSK